MNAATPRARWARSGRVRGPPCVDAARRRPLYCEPMFGGPPQLLSLMTQPRALPGSRRRRRRALRPATPGHPVVSLEERFAELARRRGAPSSGAARSGSPAARRRQADRARADRRARRQGLVRGDGPVRRPPGHGLRHGRRSGSRATGSSRAPRRIHGRPVFVFAQDFTVFGGSLSRAYAQKICKIMDLAMKAGVPDHRAQRLGRGAHPGGRRLAGRLRGHLPAQHAGLGRGPADLGDHGAVRRRRRLLAGHHRLHLHGASGSSYMFVTGPEVIKAVTHEEVTFEELGGADTHARDLGRRPLRGRERGRVPGADPRAPDLPAPEQPRGPAASARPPTRRTGCDDALQRLVPDKPNKPYDMKEIIRTVLDDQYFFEVQADYAPNLVVGFGRLGGRPVGVVANQPAHLAGCLDINASLKGARFVRFCDCFNIPLVTFEDVPGFLPGTAQEYGGIIKHGAKLLYAFCEATVPKLTVITRKAYGGAYCVMSSKHIRGDVNFAFPTAEIAVMGPEGAVNILYRRELGEAADPGALPGRARRASTARSSPTPTWRRSAGYIDEVIEPRDTRRRLIRRARDPRAPSATRTRPGSTGTCRCDLAGRAPRPRPPPLEDARARWERETLRPALARTPERPALETSWGAPVAAPATPADLPGFDYLGDLGFPGEYPYTRGVQPTMYRGRLWTMRQYAGFGTAAETNRRFRYLLAQGQTGLSVAFDLPTQMGHDADAPDGAERGRARWACRSRASRDMGELLRGPPARPGVDLDDDQRHRVHPARALRGGGRAAGRAGGDALRHRAERHPQGVHRARHLHLPARRRRMRLVTDVFAYCRDHVPRWNTISISGYHMREAGCTAVQEVAFTLANAVAYVQAAPGRGPRGRRVRAAALVLLQRPQRPPGGGRQVPGRAPAVGAHHARALRRPRPALVDAPLPRPDGGQHAHRPAAGEQHRARGRPGAGRGPRGLPVAPHQLDGRGAVAARPRRPCASRSAPSRSSPTSRAWRTRVDPLGGAYLIERLTRDIEEAAEAYIDKIDGLGRRRCTPSRSCSARSRTRPTATSRRSRAGRASWSASTSSSRTSRRPAALFQVDPAVEAALAERLARPPAAPRPRPGGPRAGRAWSGRRAGPTTSCPASSTPCGPR